MVGWWGGRLGRAEGWLAGWGVGGRVEMGVVHEFIQPKVRPQTGV